MKKADCTKYSISCRKGQALRMKYLSRRPNNNIPAVVQV